MWLVLKANLITLQYESHENSFLKHANKYIRNINHTWYHKPHQMLAHLKSIVLKVYVSLFHLKDDDPC